MILEGLPKAEDLINELQQQAMASKKIKKTSDQDVVPHFASDPCQKCKLHESALTPFLTPVYRNKGKWVTGYPPITPVEDSDGWVVIMGEMPTYDTDESGDITVDPNFQWIKSIVSSTKRFKNIKKKILYLPGLYCRPNDLEGNELPPSLEVKKLTKPQMSVCRNNYLWKLLRSIKVDRIIAVGWLGCQQTLNRMDVGTLSRKMWRSLHDNKTIVLPVHGMDYLSFDPTSKRRQKQVRKDWNWALTFEEVAHDTVPFTIAVTNKAVKKWFRRYLEIPAKKRPPLATDVETTGVDVFKKGFIAGLWSFSYKGANEALMIPTGLPDSPKMFEKTTGRPHREWYGELRKILKSVRKIVLGPGIKKFGHNLGYDINAIRKFHGWKMQGVYCDTIYLEYLIDPDNRAMRSLNSLIQDYLPSVPPYWEELERHKERAWGKKGDHPLGYLAIPSEILIPYAAWDTWVLPDILDAQLEKLESLPSGKFVTGDGVIKTTKLKDYAIHGRTRHLELCAHMEFVGLSIDAKLAHRIRERYFKEVAKLDEALAQDEQVKLFESEMLGRIAAKSSPAGKTYRMGGVPTINWASTAQVRAFFIDHQGLPPVEVTDGGLPSTNENSVREWAMEHDNEPATKLLERRAMDKFITSFLTPLIGDDPKKLVIKDDGVVHPSFRGGQVATGRLSASRPNTTALPRDGLVKAIYCSRHLGQTPSTYTRGRGWMVTRDYSGIEVRIMALTSRDSSLLTTLQNGEDVHFNTQRYFFNDKADAAAKSQRSVCKQCFFGNIYGQTDKGLFDLLKSQGVINEETGEFYTLEECTAFNNMLYEAYEGIGRWVENVQKFGIENGWVANGFGFVRQLSNLESKGYRDDILREVNFKEAMRFPDFRRLNSMINKDLRRAQNAPVQGTAGDLTTFAALRTQTELEEGGYKVQDATVCNVVHDDIWIDAVDSEMAMNSASTLARVMDTPTEWLDKVIPGYDSSWMKDVPILGDCEIGVTPKHVVSVDTSEGDVRLNLTKEQLEDLNIEQGSLFIDHADEIHQYLNEKRLMS